MKIDEACIECIINQSAKVAQAIDADVKLTNELTSTVRDLSRFFSFEILHLKLLLMYMKKWRS